MNRRLHQHGFDPRSGSPPDWLSLILASSSAAEVAATARDYLANWSPDEIAMLPRDCRPGRIRDGVDIGNLAFKLARAHCFLHADDEDGLLEKMMVFFTHASTRIAQLEGHPWYPEDD